MPCTGATLAARAGEHCVSGFFVGRPGLLAYRDALILQEHLLAERSSVEYDSLLLLEHPAVITLGRGADDRHLLRTETDLQQAGIECLKSKRVGDITLHSPGQLVGYPIVDLNHFGRDLHGYLRRLEQILIATLAAFGVAATTRAGVTGVWIGQRKIASIGVAVRRWVSWHGFALNVSNDLSLFANIVPCGLKDVTMTSMEQELGRSISMKCVEERLIEQYGERFQSPCLGERTGETIAGGLGNWRQRGESDDVAQT